MEESGQTQRDMYHSVPLFALPSYVLFPHTLVPFHVFEPGYLRTIESCLAGERLLVVAGVPMDDEGETGQPYRVAGLGRVVLRTGAGYLWLQKLIYHTALFLNIRFHRDFNN